MIYDFPHENLNFLLENIDFLCKNLRLSLWIILKISSIIFFMIYKISYYKVRISTGGVEICWLEWQFLYGLYKQRWQAGCWRHQCVLKTTLAGRKRWVLCPGMTLYIWNAKCCVNLMTQRMFFLSRLEISNSTFRHDAAHVFNHSKIQFNECPNPGWDFHATRSKRIQGYVTMNTATWCIMVRHTAT